MMIRLMEKVPPSGILAIAGRRLNLNLVLRQPANQAVLEAGVRFVLFTRLLRGRPHLLQLPGQTGTEIAHREVQTDLHPPPPALGLELIGREKFRDVLAGNHDRVQPFDSRHSRNLMRARWISTPKLVTVTSRILQISSV